MALCQAIAGMTFPAVSLGYGYYLQPRIFPFTTNAVSVAAFGFLLSRLWFGYRLALTGQYKEYNGVMGHSKPNSPAASPLNRSYMSPTVRSSSSSSPLHFPLVFPIYYKYLLSLFLLLCLQLLLSLLTPNSPVSGPVVFFTSMAVYILFHAAEQGLLVFLCQRSIGEGAIRRSCVWAALWATCVLTVVLVTASLDQQSAASEANGGNSGPFNQTYIDAMSNRARILSGGLLSPHNSPHTPPHSATGGDVTPADDWRFGSWLDVSGSVLVVDTDTHDMHYVYLSCWLCDAVLLGYYCLLFVIRIRWLRIMPWLSSRVSAFSLARFLFLRRLLSLVSILLFVIFSSHSELTFCLNLVNQAYMVSYGLCMYLFLVWDSGFWRKLEYLANGPYPAYRSLDDNGRKAPLSSASVDSTGSPPATPTQSSSIAPLLKLPRHGLTNLPPILSHLVDFSELAIDSSHPLAIGQEDTAVYSAVYRGQAVAVKRVRCDTLTIELIERELSEARMMSQISHRYVVRFIGVCIRPPAICLVSELAEGGSLLEWIKKRRREMEDEEGREWQRRGGRGRMRWSRTTSGSHVVLLEDGKDDGDDGAQTDSSTSSASTLTTAAIDLSSSFPLATILSFALDACCALTYLHSFSPPIVHRDVKASNFVLSSNAARSHASTPTSLSLSSPPSPVTPASSPSAFHLQLIDFGESRRHDGRDGQRQEKGTLHWMAPERMVEFPVPEHVRVILGEGGGGWKVDRVSADQVRRLLMSVGVWDGLGEVEVWQESGRGDVDEDEEWEAIIQATHTMRSESAAASAAPTVPSSAIGSPSAAAALPRNLSSSSNSSSSSSPSRLSSSSSSFLSRSLFHSSASRSTEKVDIYGLSLLIWSMLALQPHPFHLIPSFLVPYLVSRGVRPVLPGHTPPLLRRLIDCGWQPDNRKRPTASQMLERLECVQLQMAGNNVDTVAHTQLQRRQRANEARPLTVQTHGSTAESGKKRERERERERGGMEGTSRDIQRSRSHTPNNQRRHSAHRATPSSFGLPPLISQPSSSLPADFMSAHPSAPISFPAFSLPPLLPPLPLPLPVPVASPPLSARSSNTPEPLPVSPSTFRRPDALRRGSGSLPVGMESMDTIEQEGEDEETERKGEEHVQNT